MATTAVIVLLVVVLAPAGEDNPKIGGSLQADLQFELNGTMSNTSVTAFVDSCREQNYKTPIGELTREHLDANGELLYNCAVRVKSLDAGTLGWAYQLIVKRGGCWEANIDLIGSTESGCTGAACDYGLPEGGSPDSEVSGCSDSTG